MQVAEANGRIVRVGRDAEPEPGGKPQHRLVRGQHKAFHVREPAPPYAAATLIANSQLDALLPTRKIALPTMSTPSAAGAVATMPNPPAGNDASTLRTRSRLGSLTARMNRM